LKNFYDTSALLESNDDLTNIVISSVSLQELENIKSSANKDEEIKAKARQAVRAIERDSVAVYIYGQDALKILQDMKLPVTNDNIIICNAYQQNLATNDVVFYSEDYLCRLIAEHIFGLQVSSFGEQNNNIEPYCGYKIIVPSDEELAALYQDMSINRFNCAINEYVCLNDADGNTVDKLKWNGQQYVNVAYKKINNEFMGKLAPRNLQQVLAFDMLQDKDSTIKCLTGSFGTGKSILMIANALDLINKHQFDKMVFVRNNIEVKNTQPIGFLPGEELDKILPFAMILADKCGGEVGLRMLIQQGKIEIVPLGFIRGRDFKNSIIYCTECENMTKEHIQLLIGRVGENSQLWLDGDYKQIDGQVFTNNNGLKQLINKLQGDSHFGYVKLEKTERSETAALADKLD
jgi:PhoH-like ATPase